MDAHPLARIRWDRIGRWSLLAVFLLILYLYISPVTSLWHAWGEAAHQRQAVAALKDRNAQLRERKAGLLDESRLEEEARRLGMVKAGERAYVVQGLPKD
jgi:cell division protein FtsB